MICFKKSGELVPESREEGSYLVVLLLLMRNNCGIIFNLNYHAYGMQQPISETYLDLYLVTDFNDLFQKIW